jgi:hypothetical protein
VLVVDVVVLVELESQRALPHMHTLFDDWLFKQSVA